MKPKLKFWILNCKNGFSSVITLILLPLITFIIYSVASVVVITSFKAEYKFICIDESLKLQEKLISELVHSAAFNQASRENFNLAAKVGSLKIAEKLNQIKTGVQYNNFSFIYPKIETENPDMSHFRLVFDLDYSFINKYRIQCGVKLLKENNIWKSEIIY